MPLTPGARIGPYEVTGTLGAGGMGEVYRARDTKLGRDVALKIIPETFALDADRVARFKREAQVLASLNDPHIAAIYGFEDSGAIHALVLELVEGDTLAEQITRRAADLRTRRAGPSGPAGLPIDEALPIARQIAEALEAAHEIGIIHRDLKPANIKITPAGVVKVLDFGLAKLNDPNGPNVPNGPNALSMSPTITSPAMMTGVGMILGTAAYMSPEQAKGRPADKRSDVWSFGCVLYEMLTGRRAFDGEDVADTLACVLTREPEWSALPAGTPASIRRLLRRCLEKDRKRRLDSVAAARIEIDDAQHEPVAPFTAAPSPRASRRREYVWAAAALLLLVAAATLALRIAVMPAPDVRTARFDVAPPEEGARIELGQPLSPDGRTLAFAATSQGKTQIWVRPLDSSDAHPLAGTEGATRLFWSPDSNSIGFFSGGRLKKVALAGGLPQIISNEPGRDGAWSADNVILIGGQEGKPLFRVSGAGGEPMPETTLDESSDERSHDYPDFLPDGRHYLYVARSADAAQSVVYVGTLGSKERRPLAGIHEGTRYSSTGHVMFVRAGTLMAQRFDLSRLELSGEAVPVAEQVLGGIATTFSVSINGTLAYLANNATEGSQLLWYDRAGKQLGQLGPVANYQNIFLSADGKTVMVDRADESNRFHMWAGDVVRGVFSRPNAGDSQEMAACALRDGRVAFTYSPPGTAGDIYVSAANGAGAPEAWVISKNLKHVDHCSPDGRYLIYDDHNGGQRQDLWILPVTPPASGPPTPIPFLTTAADETFGQFSPDGNWVAYSSDETGRREVYVREFAADRVPAVGAGKWLVSTAGGDKPRWRHDGRELFYLGLDRRMMAVPVKSAPMFELGIPVALFDVDSVGFVPYDVSADGRFLINTPVAAGRNGWSPLNVILNGTMALQK